MDRKGQKTEKAKNCMIFVSHKIDDSMMKYVSFLQREANGVMDFIILYDCASSTIEQSEYPDFVFHIFNSKTLKGFFHDGDRKLPNPLVALLDLKREKRYEHYLLMESDVVFTGNFNTLLKSLSEEECDYIHIATDRLGNPQAHWPIELIRENPFKKIYFSWSQLFYVSYQFLVDLEKFMNENDSFYYEFLMPSMAYNRGYSIRQFENMGYFFQVSWGPADYYEYIYQSDRKFNTFYHPIKDLSIVDFR